MFTPVSIKIENFQSHEHSAYQFAAGKATMVYGINQQDEGANSNGSGKSALVKALAVCLLDTYDPDYTKDDYIRDGEDQCVIFAELYNPLLKVKLEVERKVFRTKSSRLFIWENGVENPEITSVKEGNEYILKVLGVPKEDLINYFFIDSSNSGSFFLSTDSQQKKVISRFVNLSPLDSALQTIKVEGQSLEADLNDLEWQFMSTNEKIVGLQESIEYETNGRFKEVSEKKDDLKDRLETVAQSVQGLNDRLLEFSEDLSKYLKKKPKSENPTKKIKKLEGIRLKDNDKLGEARVTAQELNEFLSELRIKLSDSIVCPKCSHEFSLADPDLDLEEAKENIKEYEEHLVKLKQLQKELKSKVDRTYIEEEVLRTRLSELNRIGNRIETLENNINSYKKRIQVNQELEQEIKDKIGEIKKLKVDEVRLSQLNKEVSKNESKLLSLKDDILAKEDLILENKTLVKVFSKDFKSYLIRKTLSVIEGHVNSNLQKFNTNLEVRINGYAENKSGEISDKIDVQVSRDGENWKKFKRHSGGQKQRINVCGILALHHLINNNAAPAGLDFLSLDEIFEGLDYLGQKEIISILRKADTTSMVISHNADNFAMENELYVVYNKSISRLTDKEL